MHTLKRCPRMNRNLGPVLQKHYSFVMLQCCSKLVHLSKLVFFDRHYINVNIVFAYFKQNCPRTNQNLGTVLQKHYSLMMFRFRSKLVRLSKLVFLDRHYINVNIVFAYFQKNCPRTYRNLGTVLEKHYSLVMFRFCSKLVHLSKLVFLDSHYINVNIVFIYFQKKRPRTNRNLGTVL